MPRSNRSPTEDFQIITKYKELDKVVSGFADGDFNSVVLCGDPGVSKSETIKRAIDKTKVLYLSGGQLTPIQFYMECFDHMDQPVILDDADSVMKSPVGKHLIMSLTDTRPEKTLDYRSSSKLLGSIPHSFTTKSKVCYIANSWIPDSPESKALKDRSQLFWFAPSPKEIHMYTSGWFWDQEVFDYVGSKLNYLDKHSCRIYQKAYDQKKSKLDWHQLILGQCYEFNKKILLDLEGDSNYRTIAAKVKRFCELTGLSRPTYFNYKKELFGKQQLDSEPISTDIKIKGAVPV